MGISNSDADSEYNVVTFVNVMFVNTDAFQLLSVADHVRKSKDLKQ